MRIHHIDFLILIEICKADSVDDVLACYTYSLHDFHLISLVIIGFS